MRSGHVPAEGEPWPGETIGALREEFISDNLRPQQEL